MNKIYSFIFTFTVSIGIINAGVQGSLPGLFSVSATKKVYFSQGNLQYRASNNVWRFAENQWNFVGNDNEWKGSGNGNVYQDGVRSSNGSISSTYTGWIDLFAWGTGNVPTSINAPSTTFTDWGVNAISNGGNQANLWRTLTRAEWQYICSGRPNATNLRSCATVNGARGLIFLPDDWTLPSGLTFTPNVYGSEGGLYWNSNTYSISEWQQMERNGAIFLPNCGYRYDGTSSGSGGKHCTGIGKNVSGNTLIRLYYWTATYSGYSPGYGGNLSYRLAIFDCTSTCPSNYGIPVRLVLDSNKNTFTITWKQDDGSIINTTEVASGAMPTHANPTKPSTAQYTYEFAGWTPTIVAATANATYTATYTQTLRSYTVTWKNDDGSTITTQQVNYGEAATPPTVDIPNCMILSWDKDYSNITGDMTITAVWTVQSNGETPVSKQSGALPGVFSVGGGKYVCFSKGNLKYVKYDYYSGYFCLATNQYDIIGVGNQSPRTVLDLFGWGTSGYDSKYPTLTSDRSSDYVSNSTPISGTNYDWGVYNSILNGGNKPNMWRTMNEAEWKYLLEERPTAAIRKGKGTVHGVKGLILLPDNWQKPECINFDNSMSAFTDNVYSDSEWMAMEKSGAVFLPAEGGYRSGTGMGDWLTSASYWTSGTDGSKKENYPYTRYAYSLQVDDNVYIMPSATFFGHSVRLVCDTAYVASYSTITAQPSSTEYGTVTGGGVYDNGTEVSLTATPKTCYQFTQWSDGNTDNPRTIIVSGEATYTAEFEKFKYTITTESDNPSQGSATVE